MNRRGAALALACACACARSAANHEELGDRAYAAGAYADALAEYQLGLVADPESAPLLARTAAAAFHTGNYTDAAAHYRALARADGSRSDEAADGLERVVRAALDANDRVAVAVALAGLQEVTPRRPLGRYARIAALDAVAQGNTAVALALLPNAVAASPDGRAADSLLYLYGVAAARAADCSTAVPVFEGVIRRRREPDVVDGAREGVAQCALLAGLRALDQGTPGSAEDWFRRAAAPGAAPDVMRAAFLGLGDVKLAQGDLIAALDNYQQALLGGTPGDTIAQRAQEKINALGRAQEPVPQ